MCPAGRINPEDVPSGRGQTQSMGSAVRVCATQERNIVEGRGGGGAGAFGPHSQNSRQPDVHHVLSLGEDWPS